jgi:hypothetical protein
MSSAESAATSTGESNPERDRPPIVDGGRPAGGVARGFFARIEALLLALTMLTGLAAWAVGIGTVGYDYDEVMRTHSIWLAAQGLRPYRDFLDCHPPYFALLAPVVRRHPADPCGLLLSLRMFSALGNLLFLGGLAVLAASSSRSGWWWALLGLTLVACSPSVLGYLVEFRIDGWGYALVVWSIVRFRRRAPGAWRDFEFGGATGIASLWLCPKLALLPPLVVLAEHFIGRRSIRSAARGFLAYIAGAGVALGLFLLDLGWQGIPWGRAFEVLVRYNAVSNANLATRHGLLLSLLHNPILFGAVLAGLIALAVEHSRQGTRPDAYAVALVPWLVIQALIVAYPYKQYYGPWFLFASGLLGPLGRALSGLPGRMRLGLVLASFALAVAVDGRLARIWSNVDVARADQRLIRWMNRVTRPLDRVVASPPLHPIDRYDTFFLWFNTLDPGGFDAERILARLPRFRDYVAPGRFDQELEEHPPALVVLSGDWRIVPYPPEQRQALAAFLRRNGYGSVRVRGAWFALRPDRLEQARRDGLLETIGGRPSVPAG